MKKYYLKPLRHALAVLLAGLVLGGLVAAHAQSVSTNVFYLSKTTTNLVAPYSAGGGVPAGALQNPLVTITNNNATISWYGMRGVSTIVGAPIGTTNWVTLGTVMATNYSTTATVPVPNSFSGGGIFYVVQNNAYVGLASCAGCHADQYVPYSSTVHAGVYSDPALQASLPLTNLTAGYGQPTGFTDATRTPYLENVSCENCHGPAGWHNALGGANRDLVYPAVSLDPAICGSCHQGSVLPTYNEWTNILTTTAANLPFGVFRGGVGHSTGNHTQLGCSPCHAANNRMAMVKEYYDSKATNSHPVTLFTSTDAKAFGAATCATCHDPHGSTNVAQLRYPTSSTNWYCVPTVTDPRLVLFTNSNGSVTTNSGAAYNTIFDSFFNPNVQLCGQCHAQRGTRWDGTTYGLITNNLYSTNVTLAGIVNQGYYTTNLQVFTNTYPGSGTNITVRIETNAYVSFTQTNSYWTNGYTAIVTNPTIAMGVYYPLIPYTNSGTVYYSTNSKGDSSQPHYANQYNVLIGQLDYDYATNAGVPIQIHTHGNPARNTNQCIQCHVPSYAVNAGTNVTGHTFVRNNVGCQITGCHDTYSSAALDAKVFNLKTNINMSISRVVSLLNQWATNLAPSILRTNYGQMAWEYPGVPSNETLATTNASFKAGPPSAWNGLGGQPSFTNDNLQMKYIPLDIRIARFSLYSIYKDQSLGVHNPTYVNTLLTNAEARVLGQFTSANYSASFAAKTVTGFAPLSVAFTNYGTATTFGWNFGDGQDYSGYTSANPTYTYTNPGLYSVTCTADGKPLTRANYIWVLAKPVVSFTADSTNVPVGTTVNFSNTSSNTASVYRWTWSPRFTNSVAPTFETTGGSFSFTYTNAGTYSVTLRASCPGGSSNRVTATNNAYITVY